MAFKVYTKTGDKGTTALWGGKRLSKGHLKIESYGTVDELNAYIGLVRDSIDIAESKEWLIEIQNKLFNMGSFLASAPGKEPTHITLDEADITFLEQRIDKMEESLPPLKNFILPGGSIAVSHIHVARCICRRAERRVVSLLETETVGNDYVLAYLNRLSDFLFVLGRFVAHTNKIEETIWTP